ncbi:unnamed protein product [Gordionus sp. m RMFG-2023]|uniref:major facilitator superfamily domain-containing protein 12-like isoform X2 n=1 Tax=Gordionus sp. m RMFG-2023 TaxID=3053472 RepID=UPI0030E4689F
MFMYVVYISFADGISTLFVGIESDETFINSKYGQRKIWHLIGTICVTLSFAFIFSPPPLIFMPHLGFSMFTPAFSTFNYSISMLIAYLHAMPQWVKMIYYVPLIIVFQFGWACVQISHLSLIPRLSSDPNIRVELTSFRYAFSVSAYILTYTISWYFLHSDKISISKADDKITPKNIFAFEKIVFSVIGLGIISSLIFHLMTKEPNGFNFNEKSPIHPERDRDKVNDAQNSGSSFESNSFKDISINDISSDECIQKIDDHVKRKIPGWRGWLKIRLFYQNSAVYMLTRLSSNISMVYIPLYLLETQKLDKTCIALIPLVIYISGFVTALCMKRLNILLGRKIVYALGTILLIVSCMCMWFQNLGTKIYIIAPCLGAATSTLIIVSLSLTADLIGSNIATSSFIYGSMSLVDKISNGLAILLLQNFYPFKDITLCGDYFRYIMTFFPSIATILALAIVVYMPKMYKDNSEETTVENRIDEIKPLLS